MKRAVLWLVSLGLAGMIGYAVRDLQEMFGDLHTAGVIEWQHARMQFVDELSAQACVTADHVRDAAAARGWTAGPDFIPGGAPFDRADEVVWVDIRPPLPFSKWDRSPFGFGADGCYLD